jgi:L-rhamnose mutarotase
MTRVAWTARLRPDKVDEYVEAHANVWPDALAAITAAGIRNYSIFLSGNRVFAYYECDDPDEAVRVEAEAEATQRWRAHMRDLFEDEVATEGVDFLPEIFRLD